MKNDKIVDMLDSIELSDDAKNRIHAKVMQKVKKNNPRQFYKKTVAAALVGVLAFSAVVYAAAPAIWRYFNTRVIQGEEFVSEFVVGELKRDDGTSDIFGAIEIDNEALDAADGGIVIFEVDGEKLVYLDELHFDNLEDGLALLQLENVLLPTLLPEGFNFSRFTFPVNPHNHQFRMGTIPAGEQAFIYFSSGSDIIGVQIMSMPNEVRLVAFDDQQGLSINGIPAVLMGGILSVEELAMLEGVIPFDGIWDNTLPPFGSDAGDGELFINMLWNGILYGVFTNSQTITPFDLVKMAESMHSA